MSKAEEAKKLFLSGANCAQAVFGAFAEECGLTREEAFRIASGFGAGMGKMREVCGAVSGMFLVANCKYGCGDISNKAAKDAQYALIQRLADSFRQETGSIICRELLGLDKNQSNSPISEDRTPQYYRKRPCAEMVAMAADLADSILKNPPPELNK